MRISRGTVKSTTSRALAALGRILGEAVMNLIEDRIRAAARAAAETVAPYSVPPLELPAEHPRGDGWRRRWLVPAAAAAAVVIVIAVTALTVGPGTRTRAPASAPGGAATGPMLPGPRWPPMCPPARSRRTSSRWLSPGRWPRARRSPSCTIRSAAAPWRRSGRRSAAAPSWGVSAAGDDRTFVLDEQSYVKPKHPFPTPWQSGPHSFYLLRLSSAGRVSSLGRLRVAVRPRRRSMRSRSGRMVSGSRSPSSPGRARPGPI